MFWLDDSTKPPMHTGWGDELAKGMKKMTSRESEAVESLGKSLKPLKEHFNAGSGTHCFVALLSPTSPACVRGACGVETGCERLPQSRPRREHCLNRHAAERQRRGRRRASEDYRRPACAAVLRPAQQPVGGKSFAHGLIREGAGVAWDIYLFNDKDARGDENPPKPIDYLHQLGGGRRADPERFHSGDELVRELHKSMERIFDPSSK